MLKFVLSLILIPALSYGDTRIFGQDMLAAQLPGFRVEKAIPYVSPNTALGILDYTFGTDIAPVHRLLNSRKFSVLRVHLINSSCIANSNCGPYEIGYGYSLAGFNAAVLAEDPKIISFLTARSKVYCGILTNYPAVKLLISPVLEHRLTPAAYQIAANSVLKGCPNVQLVNNPVTGKGERYKGAWIEAHATSVPADIYSWDGVDATDSDVATWIKQTAKAKIAFWWARAYNARAGGGSFVDPRARTAVPTAQYFELMNHLQDDRGKAPKPTFRATFKPFSKPNIFKPCSENYEGSSDPRGLLPVAILPGAAGMMNVVGAKGIRVGQMKFFGAYQGNLNRYYSGTAGRMSGYEFEKEASKTNGSPFTWVCQNRICYGPIIGGRRNGLMR
jgi:hypothetical protein